MNVGYIGLGAMGGALASSLLGKQQLSVWDVNQTAVAAFEKLGATVAGSAADLARTSDVVILCLPRTEDVEKVIFGPNGLIDGLSPGKIVIDQTSGIPNQTRDLARRLAERGVSMIDAPISGGISGARAGTITIMSSGPDEHYDKALPVLHSISPNVFRCGKLVGCGQAMKIVNNAMSAGCRLGTLEVVAMGKKMGLSLKTMTDVINKGSGRNRTSKVMLQGLANGKLTPTSFAISLMVKDLNQAIDLGMECGSPMTITNIVRGILQIGANTLGENAQLDEVMGLIESMAGTKLVDLAEEPMTTEPSSKPAVVESLTVGYVGLGAMGGALTRRLMLSRKMHVYDANPQAVRELEAQGAVAATDLASLARACDVIMVCVPTSAIVRQVLFGKGGLAEGLAPGKIVIDQTTGDPSETRRIAAELSKLGVAMVDAPVSGGPRGADAGTIAIMCGGPADAYARVFPILQSMSPNFVYCGPVGNGHVAKLVNNAVAACNRLITYESVSMGFKYGLSIEHMDKVINASTGWNGASERILPVLASAGETSNFQLALMVKDLKLAAQMASGCGAPMLIANTVRNIFEVGANQLGGTEKLDDMARFFEAMSAIKFRVRFSAG